MTPRAIVLLMALLPASAGCLGVFDDALDSASMDRTWNLDGPASRIQPTGNVVEFDLYLHNMPAHEVYPGAEMQMWGFSLDPDPSTATVPGPTLRATAGDLVRVTFHNTLAGFLHTIHWHGVHVPFTEDGVPYMTQEPVQPGGEFTYEFIAKPSGTFWYHCHVDTTHHVDMGMYGAFIIDPQDPEEDPPYDREYVLQFDDMDKNHITTLDPTSSNRPQNGDPQSYEEWLRQQARDGVNKNEQVQDTTTGTPVKPAREWWPVTHNPYNVEYNTHVINGVSFPYTEPLFIDDGEVVRLRLINVGNLPHAVHLHGHHVLVTHKDGILLDSPYWADTVPMLPGERYDVYVKGDNPGIWDLHDHATPNANDDIWPGGAMTVLAYEDYKDKVMNLGHDHGRGSASPEALWTWQNAPEFWASGMFVRSYALA